MEEMMQEDNHLKFDRNAAVGGLEIICRQDNGKMILEWRFHIVFSEQTGETIPIIKGIKEKPEVSSSAVIRVVVTDRDGNTAAECIQKLWEEEALETILLQPRQWVGVRDPYLYNVEAMILENGKCADRVSKNLPLRTVENGKNGELLLNGRVFVPKPVLYALPQGTAMKWQRLVLEDFRMLSEVGANCICLRPGVNSAFLSRLCDRFGFLLFTAEEAHEPEGRQKYCDSEGTEENCGERGDGKAADDRRFSRFGYLWGTGVKLPDLENGIPVFRGPEESFFPPDSNHPFPLYYRYKARWSQAPFVYIVPESVRKLESGNYAAVCYSNCEKVALYSDGILFEFKAGENEFEFLEIPVKTPCVMLAAEGTGCSTAFSIPRSCR